MVTRVKKIFKKTSKKKINYKLIAIGIILLIILGIALYAISKKSTAGNVVAKIEIGKEKTASSGFFKNPFKSKTREITVLLLENPKIA